MHATPLKLISTALLALAGCAPLGLAGTPTTFTNPVLDADFPDPAVIKAPDGFYYAYATQTKRGDQWINIQAARSADLVSWQPIGDALPTKPGWASKTQDFWAPHVIRHGDTYFMYFSAKPDASLSNDKRGLCLGVATAGGPLGPFTDKGTPLHCGDGFVNIDPMAFDDPATGKPLLYWGSGFQPIKVQELGRDRMSFAPGSSPANLIPVIKDDPAQYRQLVEGAWVMQHDGWYYLFYSGNNCCGKDAHYAVLVARSRNAAGPFETRGPDPVVLAARGKWVAPGHNAVIRDARGDDWLVYHSVDAQRPRTVPSDEINTRRILLIDRIKWRDGWPSIAGDGPSTEPQMRPATR
ncbi:MAG: glycoside hydrolase family 43 protein [Sphingomicrobium sp.]